MQLALGGRHNIYNSMAAALAAKASGIDNKTIRIKEGDKIEEAHMRNRALIAWWVPDMPGWSVLRPRTSWMWQASRILSSSIPPAATMPAARWWL